MCLLNTIGDPSEFDRFDINVYVTNAYEKPNLFMPSADGAWKEYGP